jgi:glycosidase
MTDVEFQSEITFDRLYRRLESQYLEYAQKNPGDWLDFSNRLKKYFPTLFKTLYPIYGEVFDWFYYLEEIFLRLAESWTKRSTVLKNLDLIREKNPTWYQSEKMVGAVCYVDLYARNLKGLLRRIPYFKELGISYLHLMPLFKSPEGENDGGYAVSSYREVDPSLGDMNDLVGLAKDLRNNGINLVLDFVFNHTSDEHIWADKAKEGDQSFQDYYLIFPDRKIPDRFEANLREIFPNEHSGAFTYNSQMDSWVWTTFHSYQWDLNYQNPAVFVSMANEMLALANIGVDVLRLDAVAFIWKKLGTSCENLPEVHALIKAFNLIIRIAAPGLVLKSEAIVHPDEVAKYIDPSECQLSYNPLLMALLWESLATREVRLLTHSLKKRFKIPEGSTWVNYVRCHDDIGWTFSNEDANEVSINGYDHRKFLNNFYQGRFHGSFAKGLPFQTNPLTGDSRISGTCASLAGLEKAVTIETEVEVDLAVKRILLLHGIIMTIGGIPLIYLGDEFGTLNDYSFAQDRIKSMDSRWVHRSEFIEETALKRTDYKTTEGQIFQGIKELIKFRTEDSIFANGETEFIELINPHVLCYTRRNIDKYLLVLANFSEHTQIVTEFKNVLTYDNVSGLNRDSVDFSEGLKLGSYELKFIEINEDKNLCT